jgi:uncharacterized membrane protein
VTTSERLPNSVFVVLLVYMGLQARFEYDKLPEFVANHFVAGGRANGWQAKSQGAFAELIAVGMAALIAFGVPRLIAVVPVSMLNLPNKEYWFASERLESTLAYFRAWFAWMGSALLLFLIVVYELVFRANQVTPPTLNTRAFVTALFAFLGFTLVWVMRMIVHFSRKRTEFT